MRMPRLSRLALLVALATLPAQTEEPAGKPGAAGADDEQLVRNLLTCRSRYKETLEQLRLYYVKNGDTERARWAEEELKSFHRISKQAFRMELEVGPPTLGQSAKQNIPEANDLYRRAMAYKDKGYGLDYVDNQRRAELLLQELLTSYSQSDKIGEAAFMLGDIYESKANKQYRRAAQYYERAFQWNSTSQHEARLRAARLYDRQLIDRKRAKELYQEIKTHDTDPRRMQEAERRLTELGNQRN